jgi:bacillolysin
MNNASGESPSGYSYYNNIMMNANVGSTNTIQIIIDTTFSQGLATWIDYNQDGDFYDAREYLGNVLGTSSVFGSTVVMPINIPTTARNCYVRLRVAATNNSDNLPCGGNIFGEYEDYDLNISGGLNNPNIVWSPASNLSSANGISVDASNIMS